MVLMGALICTLVFSITLNVMFQLKKHIFSSETRIFSIALIVNIIGFITEIFCKISINSLGMDSIYTKIVTIVYLIYQIMFVSVISIYVLFSCIDDKEKYKKSYKKLNILYYILSFIVIFLPFQIHKGYATGIAVYYTYIIASISMTIWLLLIIINYKREKIRQFIPLIILIVFGTFAAAIQLFNPSITLITCVHFFVLFIMYHTIENPDMKMIEKLELAKEEADKANHAKTDFLSSMSHEIRTPLNAIVGFSECIKSTDDIEEAHNDADDVIKASHTLLEIVNGILDISKIEAGKLEIVNSDYNSKELFKDVAKLVKPRMEEKALDFQISIASDIPDTLYGDNANVQKVITNVLGNAAKYTEKGYVKYDVRCINNKNICRLVISIEDSGRGIKKENIDKLFTKFQRLDEDRNTTIEGTGLGLAITKQLVELMGGKIIVQSVYGSGSKFTIIIDQRIEKVIVEAKKKEDLNINIDLTNKKILIVDDNPLNLKVASKILSGYNPIIEVVDNGFSCVEKINNGEKYDLILLDDMMPKKSGVETLNELKQIKGFNTVTIALTANAITGMREKYLDAGFDEYLAKPINRNELKRLLIKYLVNNDRSINFGELPHEIYEIGSTAEIPITGKIEETSKIPEEETKIKEDTSSLEYLKSNNIDVEKALELLGDVEMYNSTIKEFISGVDEKVNKLSSYKNENNMKDYAIEVHSLKSDSKYLGFNTLAEIAYDQELKSKENDSDYISKNYDKLITELKKNLEIVKKYLK